MSTLVVLTKARVRSIRQLPEFAWLSIASVRSALSTNGNRGVRIRPRRPLLWYTMTAWQDEDAVRRFMLDAPHKAAMRATRRLTHATSFARIEIDGSLNELPWSEAYRLLDEAPERQRAAGRDRNPARHSPMV
jgi:hypothetical protein